MYVWVCAKYKLTLSSRLCGYNVCVCVCVQGGHANFDRTWSSRRKQIIIIIIRSRHKEREKSVYIYISSKIQSLFTLSVSESSKEMIDRSFSWRAAKSEVIYIYMLFCIWRNENEDSVCPALQTTDFRAWTRNTPYHMYTPGQHVCLHVCVRA